MLVTAAETCCEEDVYHFDDIERFFLVSCLSLWWVSDTLWHLIHYRVSAYCVGLCWLLPHARMREAGLKQSVLSVCQSVSQSSVCCLSVCLQTVQNCCRAIIVACRVQSVNLTHTVKLHVRPGQAVQLTNDYNNNFIIMYTTATALHNNYWSPLCRHARQGNYVAAVKYESIVIGRELQMDCNNYCPCL